MSLAGVPSVSIDMLTDAAAVAGACLVAANLGSFLNVVAYRVPRGMSVARGRSRCPACGHPVRWHDNVPVLGWLLLGGRCRDCGAAIASRYPTVEAAAGMIGGIAALELFSGGHIWPDGRFGIGRTGIDVLLVEADWPRALVCAAHATLLFALLAWTLFEFDRTRLSWAWVMATVAGLVGLAVVAGGPTVLPGWTAGAQAAAGAGVGVVLGATVSSPWLRQALVFVGAVLGWQALVCVGAILAPVAAGRVAMGRLRGRFFRLEPACGDLLVATALQVLAWRWLTAG